MAPFELTYFQVYANKISFLIRLSKYFISFVSTYTSFTSFPLLGRFVKEMYKRWQKLLWRTTMIKIDWISKRMSRRRIITWKLYIRNSASFAIVAIYIHRNSKICNEREIMKVGWQYRLIVLIKNNSKKLFAAQSNPLTTLHVGT